MLSLSKHELARLADFFTNSERTDFRTLRTNVPLPPRPAADAAAPQGVTDAGFHLAQARNSSGHAPSLRCIPPVGAMAEDACWERSGVRRITHVPSRTPANAGCYGFRCQGSPEPFRRNSSHVASGLKFSLLAAGGVAGLERVWCLCACGRSNPVCTQTVGARYAQGRGGLWKRRRAGLSRVCYSCAFVGERPPSYRAWLWSEPRARAE
jgi:hypothetical protein